MIIRTELNERETLGVVVTVSSLSPIGYTIPPWYSVQQDRKQCYVIRLTVDLSTTSSSDLEERQRGLAIEAKKRQLNQDG